MKQPLQCSGRTIQGHIQLLPHDLDRCVYVGDAAKHIGYQVDVFVSRSIPAVRELVIRGTVNVVKNRSR